MNESEKTVEIQIYPGTALWNCTHDIPGFSTGAFTALAKVVDQGAVFQFEMEGDIVEVSVNSATVISYIGN